MVYKSEKREQQLYEVIYSETGAEYRKRHLEITGGKTLKELLAFDFEKFNVFIKENLSKICERGSLDLSGYEEFCNLSEETRFLLLYTSEIRFLVQRSRVHGYNVKHDYFVQLIKLLNYIKVSVDQGKDSEDFFRFYFKYYLRVLDSESIYESKHDLNILNYIFPVAYAYAKGTTSKVKELETLLSKAETNKEHVTDIIEFVPQGSLYFEIMQVLKNLYWIGEQKRYRSIPIPFNQIIDEFNLYPELQQKFLECIYEYDVLNKGKLFIFKSIEEYVALAILECYKKGCPVSKCKECNKYFVRTSNSRRLCGSKECVSKNKRRSAAQRKGALGVNDNNVLNAVYRALCYSNYATESPRHNLSAYEAEDGISKAVSAKIVTFLDDEIYIAYRKDNKRYKAEIKALAGRKKEEALCLYQMWLEKIKKEHSHQNVLERYRKGIYDKEKKEKDLEIDYYSINEHYSIDEGIINNPKILNLDEENK